MSNQPLVSRIAIRLLAFNILLVFLPVAGILYLGNYEVQLESALQRSMTEQARLVASVFSQSGLSSPDDVRHRVARLDAATPATGEPSSRLRIVDRTGVVVADSHAITPRLARIEESIEEGEDIRENWLYRLGSFLVRPVVRLIRPPDPPLEQADFYEKTQRLSGTEVADALRGKAGFKKRASPSGRRSITLYTAVPIWQDGWVIGSVVLSRSTWAILRDLYVVRLGVFKIFLASVAMAILLSLWIGATIARPLRQLQRDAAVIVDPRGRIRGRFHGSSRGDEIGDLARALETLTRRVERYVLFIESFGSDISHELKNPLASIRTATEMLYEVTDPKERKRFLNIVEQDVARMQNLLTGLREVSLIDARIAIEETVPVAIGELVAEVIEGFDLRGSSARFEIDRATPDPVVEASHDRLTQVIENLIDNAISFSPRGESVRVTTSAEDAWVVVRVEDRGPGIPATHAEKIFDRFFSYRPGDRSAARTHTGLGLAIVRAIVEGYGGSVSASNVEPAGAVFEIRLPRSAKAPR